jgi:hypothetical protein
MDDPIRVAERPEMINTIQHSRPRPSQPGFLNVLLIDIVQINQIYGSLTPSVQRRLNHLFFAEIRSHLKRRESKGLLDFHIRGDGTITADWEDIVNQISTGSSSWDSWLHERPESSDFFILIIPINIENLFRRDKKLTVDGPFVSEYLMMSDDDIRRLTKFFSIPRKLEPG